MTFFEKHRDRFARPRGDSVHGTGWSRARGTPRNHRAEVFWCHALNDSLLWTEDASTKSLAMVAAAIAYGEQSGTSENVSLGLVSITLDETRPSCLNAGL